jgi:purine-binding chemotaxis protein CheW
MANSQLVVFKVGGEEFGIDIMKVFGIEKYQDIVRVPNTPTYIEGMINLRGEVYPIYNLRKKFHMDIKQADENTKFIIVNTNDMMVGLIVDAVVEIIHIEENNMEAPPKLIAGSARRYIAGVGKVGQRMIIILDVDLIMNDQEQTEINNMLDEHNKEE